MKTEQLDLNQAMDLNHLKIEGYMYAWIQSEDNVFLGPIENAEIDKDTLLEARIFSYEKEIHIFPYDDVMRAVVTIKEPQDKPIERKQILRKRFGRFLTQRDYIGYEADGQAYIIRSVLCDYDGGEN